MAVNGIREWGRPCNAQQPPKRVTRERIYTVHWKRFLRTPKSLRESSFHHDSAQIILVHVNVGPVSLGPWRKPHAVRLWNVLWNDKVTATLMRFQETHITHAIHQIKLLHKSPLTTQLHSSISKHILIPISVDYDQRFQAKIFSYSAWKFGVQWWGRKSSTSDKIVHFQNVCFRSTVCA